MKQFYAFFASIVISIASFAQNAALLTLPEGAVTEDYTLTGTMYSAEMDEEIYKTVKVAFVDYEVYIQGLSYWFPESWAKGILAGDKFMLSSNQYMGSDEYGDDYLVGYRLVGDSDYESTGISIVFDYDAETRTFTLNESNFVGEADAPNSKGLFNYCFDFVLTPGAVKEDEVVTPPATLQVDAYKLTANYLSWDDQEQQVRTAVTDTLYLGMDGNDVYLQGLNPFLPEAWIAGTKNGNTLIFPTGQYFGMGTFQGVPNLKMYFIGYGENFIEDAVFTMSDNGKTITTDFWLLINSMKNTASSFRVFCDVVLTKIEGGTGVRDVEIAENQDFAIYDMAGRRVKNAQKRGIFIRNGKKYFAK